METLHFYPGMKFHNIPEGDSKFSAIFFHLLQEQARLLTVGSIKTCESTCQNTASGDLELISLVAFGL
jgi:hypothetical protein